MMKISDMKDDEKGKELFLLKLEQELNNVKLAHKFNEALWVEKEESLNSIISEQKKVISLLESLLKGNQQWLDTVQASISQKNDQIELINTDVNKYLVDTNEQVDILKKNADRAETLLKDKDIELDALRKEVNEQRTCVQKLTISLQDGISEREILSKKLLEEQALLEAVRQEKTVLIKNNSDLQKQYQSLSASHLSLKEECGKSQQRISRLQDEQREARGQLEMLSQKNEQLQKTIEREKIAAGVELKRNLETSKKNTEAEELRTNSLRTELQQTTKQYVEKLANLQLEKQSVDAALEKINVKMEGLLAREIRYKKNIIELEERVIVGQDKVRQTISYQLGYAILQAGKSFHGFISLPQSLIRIRREAKNRKQAKLLRLTGSRRIPRKEGLQTGSAHIVSSNDLQVLNVDVSTGTSKLKIAGVMDEFTYHSYAPEAEVLQLHPEAWEQQLGEFKPDLLFIESAWQGLDGLWKTKISNAKEEIQGAIKWCNLNNVPTIFWNKEDPVHFGTFLPIASMVDFVFTTDIDCIPKYKQRVGHKNVFLLPFAAQPKTHNPIEKFARKDAFNFAGSYYLRYPERQRDFASLMDTVQQFRGVEVYDRNFDNPHPHYTFPEKYKKFILGKLPFTEIDKAYKGYRYGINMNTIKQSQTMFARRVFELLASNTVVVSNFSRGVRLLFGDLVVSSDDASQLKNRLDVICKEDENYRKFRLQGLRKVLSEHTYSHRLSYIRAKLTGQEFKLSRAVITVIAKVKNSEEYQLVKSSFDRQNYDNKFLCIIDNDHAFDYANNIENVTFIRRERDFVDLINKLSGESFIAALSAQDYYGSNYLNDLELSTLYSDASVIGKSAYYTADSGSLSLVGDGSQYSLVGELTACRAIIRRKSLTTEVVEQLFSAPDSTEFKSAMILAVDEFNYCSSFMGVDIEEITKKVDDLAVADVGVSYTKQLIAVAEGLPPSEELEVDSANENAAEGLSGVDLFELMVKPASSTIQFSKHGNTFKIVSKLADGKHVYTYTKKSFKRDELNLVLNSQFKLECRGSLEAMTVFEFQDKDGKKIAHSMNKIGDSHALAIPEHCVLVRVGLKLQGSGQLLIDRLSLGTKNEKPFAIIGKGNSLVVSKQYPDYGDLYKYGFVHSRVRSYRQSGLVTDIFRVGNNPQNHYREFEGVDVASGDYALLQSTLRTGQFQTLMVHILDEKTWEVIKQYLSVMKIIIWVHGSEIQHWKRRSFEFKNMTDAEITRQKRLSDKRVKFWKEIFAQPHANLHFVFVSQWLVNSTEEDLGVKIRKDSYSIINNFVDGSIFKYSEKKVSDRLNLLSIRPYAKLVYANDLTVAAIVELSKRPFFRELNFTLIGDGELFDQTVAPVVNFPNVTIKKTFLTHAEIAKYHRQNGIFLVPSRMDTQGVSRDEAMSSGLVPITTRVAAIPEFVDDKVAMIVEGEDYKGLADAVEILYKNEQKFLELSKKASENASEKCGFEHTLQRELDLLARMAQGSYLN